MKILTNPLEKIYIRTAGHWNNWNILEGLGQQDTLDIQMLKLLDSRTWSWATASQPLNHCATHSSNTWLWEAGSKVFSKAV